jgi:hypothetical protein
MVNCSSPVVDATTAVSCRSRFFRSVALPLPSSDADLKIQGFEWHTLLNGCLGGWPLAMPRRCYRNGF